MYIAAFGKKLYSRKRKSETIVCHNRNGDILWTDETVLKEPKGIAVDEHENAIVAGVGSNNVIAISSDGTKHKILLSKNDLIKSPWSICYSSKLKILLVANDKDGHAYLYIVNHE